MGMIYLQLAVLGPRGDTELNADISACARLQMASNMATVVVATTPLQLLPVCTAPPAAPHRITAVRP